MATSFAAGIQAAADRDCSQTGIRAEVVERTVQVYKWQYGRSFFYLHALRSTIPGCPNHTGLGAGPSTTAERRHFSVDRVVKYASPPEWLCSCLLDLPQGQKSVASGHDCDGH
jgi:hypothetical protein